MTGIKFIAAQKKINVHICANTKLNSVITLSFLRFHFCPFVQPVVEVQLLLNSTDPARELLPLHHEKQLSSTLNPNDQQTNN